MKTTLCNGGKCKPLRASDVLGATAWWRFVEVVAVKPLFTWLTVSLKLAVYNLILKTYFGCTRIRVASTWCPRGWTGSRGRCAGSNDVHHASNMLSIRLASVLLACVPPNAPDALFLCECSLPRSEPLTRNRSHLGLMNEDRSIHLPFCDGDLPRLP